VKGSAAEAISIGLKITGTNYEGAVADADVDVLGQILQSSFVSCVSALL